MLPACGQVEAARVKEVLSASSVAFVSLEGLPLPPSAAGGGDSCAADGGEVPMEGVLRTNISREPSPKLSIHGDLVRHWIAVKPAAFSPHDNCQCVCDS